MGLGSSISDIFKKKPTYKLFVDVGFAHTVFPQLHTDPFRYIIIDNFLPDTRNTTLKEHFSQTLSLGLGDTNTYDRFRHRSMYDVDLFWPKPALDAPYSPFFSASVIDMLRDTFKLPLSYDTIVAYHHHEKSIEDNYIHNDFAEGHFVEQPLPNGINPWYFQCAHSAPPPGEQSRTMARALAAIYYLNDVWQSSDGGETAFFSANNPATLKTKVEPRNNRLVVFEITPTSWHSYLQSSAPSRDSVAQWFFMDPAESARRFPDIPLWKGSLGY
jgi:hypothetical protein